MPGMDERCALLFAAAGAAWWADHLRAGAVESLRDLGHTSVEAGMADAMCADLRRERCQVTDGQADTFEEALRAAMLGRLLADCDLDLGKDYHVDGILRLAALAAGVDPSALGPLPSKSHMWIGEGWIVVRLHLGEETPLCQDKATAIREAVSERIRQGAPVHRSGRAWTVDDEARANQAYARGKRAREILATLPPFPDGDFDEIVAGVVSKARVER